MDDRLDAQLSEVERHLGDMATLLVRGDAQALEDATGAMRQSMLTLAHALATEALSTPHDADTRARFEAIGRALARQRDQVARRGALADRALATVLPPPDVTYRAPGHAAPFKGTTARFYTAPGL